MRDKTFNDYKNKKIAEGKFLLIIKSLGINEEFRDDGEAFRAGLGYIGLR